MRNHRSLAVAALGAVLLSAGLIVATAAPASAHDELLSSSPEAGSTVQSPPAAITLAFSGELNTDPSSAVIEVLSADGANIATGAPLITQATISQQIAPDAADGLYTVRWRVVSSDGHPISGEYPYTVQAASAEAAGPAPMDSTAATPSPTSEASAVPLRNDPRDIPGHTQTSGGGALLPTLAILSGVVVLGCLVIVVVMVGRERRRRDRADATSGGTTDES